MPKCNSCGAEIIWARTERGRAIPLDALPAEDGNLYLADGQTTVLPKDELGEARMANIQLYKSHFATCPNAKQHRKESKDAPTETA